MPITVAITDSFQRSFTLYSDLIQSLDEPTLNAQLPQLRSNTLGQQLWCVVGARESFAQAITANQWVGFTCSLDTTTLKTSVIDSLHRSSQAVTQVLQSIDTYTDAQNRLIIDLLEHEAAHHGQIIRYLYALNLNIPQSWKTKYALD